MFNIKKFFIFLFVKSNIGRKLHSHHIIQYKGLAYTHIAWGYYIRRFFSLTFQKINEVTFLNKKNNVVRIRLPYSKSLDKYKYLPKFTANKKRIWKG